MTKAPLDGDLKQWLKWLESLNPDRIEPGLERVLAVGQRLDVLQPAKTVISIAGTNGKGSTAALIETCLLNAGHQVAVYSSPHLLRYNERLRLHGSEVEDQSLCRAFTAVAQAQGDTALTYFEFGTLAVLWLIKQSQVEVAILEVGLGGRLDAVNVVDADCAVITSIGLDHMDWLGNDRESIGYEKAGIMRVNRPAICNDAQAPETIISHAESIGAELISRGRDFTYATNDDNWVWQGLGEAHEDLPFPALPGQIYIQNAAGALAALVRLRDRLNWQADDFKKALDKWFVPGRAQCLTVNDRQIWLDVAHNREAAEGLANALKSNPVQGKTIAVFAALNDKPIAQIMAAMDDIVAHWHLADLSELGRGLKKKELVEFAHACGLQWQAHNNVRQAWDSAMAQSQPGDRLVVLGSFHTVQAVLEELNRQN